MKLPRSQQVRQPVNISGTEGEQNDVGDGFHERL